MNCPVCGRDHTEVAFVKNAYQILRCADCDHLFTNLTLTPEKVEAVYSDEYFKGGGAGYDNYIFEKDMLIHRGEYYAKKINRFMAPGKVLDIGAAAGFILKGFENQGWQGTGVEPNRSMARYGRDTMGTRIIEGTFEGVELEDEFDLIIMIQVIAHLYDLKSSMNKIRDRLKPGGYLLIETWDKDSWSARIFGKNWHEFSPPSTLNYFSKKTLQEFMLRHHFRLVAKGTPKKSIHSRHAKSLLRHKLREMPGLRWMAGLTNLIPNHLLIPYPAEDLFWYLLKRSDY